MSFSAPVSHRMSMPRFFIARIARMVRCRQVDDTIFVARKETDRFFRLRKSCSFVSFVQKESCKKYRAFRLRKSCSFVSFVQKNRARSIVHSACGKLPEDIIPMTFYLRKVKSQDNANYMKENGKGKGKSRKTAMEGAEKRGWIDLLIGMSVTIL